MALGFQHLEGETYLRVDVGDELRLTRHNEYTYMLASRVDDQSGRQAWVGKDIVTVWEVVQPVTDPRSDWANSPPPSVGLSSHDLFPGGFAWLQLEVNQSSSRPNVAAPQRPKLGGLRRPRRTSRPAQHEEDLAGSGGREGHLQYIPGSENCCSGCGRAARKRAPSVLRRLALDEAGCPNGAEHEVTPARMTRHA